jgi:hypothetical protein
MSAGAECEWVKPGGRTLRAAAGDGEGPGQASRVKEEVEVSKYRSVEAARLALPGLPSLPRCAVAIAGYGVISPSSRAIHPPLASHQLSQQPILHHQRRSPAARSTSALSLAFFTLFYAIYAILLHMFHHHTTLRRSLPSLS